MKNFRGCELRHAHTAVSSRFIRLIWAGRRVYTTSGDHAADSSDRDTQRFGTSAAAHTTFERTWLAYVVSGTYEVNYLSRPLYVPRRSLAHPDATLVANWTTDTLAWLAPGQDPRRSWVQIDNLRQMAAYDPGAATALAYLTEGPHCFEVGQDRILAQAGCDAPAICPPDDELRAMATAPGLLSLAMNVKVVCPVIPCTHAPTSIPCPSCATRLPELLAHQLRDHEVRDLSLDERITMADVARRLAHR